MSVNAVSGTQALDKNTFLRLFTTQLKHQDPLNPMDSTQFTAQLAQFSSLEQLFNIHTQLTQLNHSQNTLLQGITAGLIGKTVTLEDGTSARVAGILFEEDQHYLLLNNNQKVLLTEIVKISA